MPPVDWKRAWKEGQTPWDAGSSPPALQDMLARERVPSGRILVPGCGAGYDLAVLARADREVVGLDLSEDARARFWDAQPSLPGTVRFEIADFFAYQPASKFDFVWDYTFFCALDPEQRGAWGDQMKMLVRPTGLLAMLLFPFEDPVSDREGPPWPVNTDMVRRLIGDAFEALEVRPVDRSHSGREGRERLALWRRIDG